MRGACERPEPEEEKSLKTRKKPGPRHSGNASAFLFVKTMYSVKPQSFSDWTPTERGLLVRLPACSLAAISFHG